MIGGGVSEMGEQKPWVPARCPRDCVYRAGASDYVGCNYIFVEDKMRGCDPGPGCKRYKARSRGHRRVSGITLGNPPRSAKRTKWDVQTGFAMWLTGSSDRQIAAELAISPQTVGERRRKHWVHGRA